MSAGEPLREAAALVAALAAARRKLEAGGSVDLAPLAPQVDAVSAALVDRARTAPNAARPALAALLDELDRLQATLAHARQAVRGELIDLGSARRARAAYKGGGQPRHG